MVNNKQILENVKSLTVDFNENCDFLTDLDTKIGDGDHGNNMAKGFNSIEFNKLEDESISGIFKHIAMKLISTVGGASGPIYGTLFMEYAKYSKDIEELSIDDIIKMNEMAIEGIKARGRATFGDKTLLDVLIPFVEELEQTKDLEKAKNTLDDSFENTKTYVCKVGRASYLGERSLGHADPGCGSMRILLKGLL